MKLRPLGRTGIQVSPYCLGTMKLGRAGNTDLDECTRIVHRALDAGINFIDTADVYSGGESEEILGTALRGRRDEVVLATKVNGPMGADPNRAGSSRRWIITAVEESLRRLRTDHIDLYQLHHPDPHVDIEEPLSALTDLMKAGKVRAIGSSSMPASDIVESLWVSERLGLARFRTEQPTYSILNRAIEREVLPVCRRHGMGTLVWSPLAMGLLTGRFRPGGEPLTAVHQQWVPNHMTDQRKHAAVEALAPIAEEAGLSLTHLAMAFTMAHPAVTSAIIGPRTLGQLEDLLAGVHTSLGDDVLDRIDDVVAPGTDIGSIDVAYTPAALTDATQRRRSAGERAAA